jgi:hypothetical protein
MVVVVVVVMWWQCGDVVGGRGILLNFYFHKNKKHL